MTRTTLSSDSKWEPLLGYSRAVRVGPYIHVSGTTATEANGRVAAPEDAGAQAEACFRKIEDVLVRAGASLAHVVRTRMYVADIRDADAIGRVHRAIFGEIRPAATMVEISAFIAPDILVEIEVDAIVEDD